MLRACSSLRWFTQHVPVCGRLKLADKPGAVIAPGDPETIHINGINVRLDHSILTHA